MRLLYELKIGEEGIIRQITELHIPNKEEFIVGEIESRLLEMGFIEGALIKVLHRGFWRQEPIAVRINNNNTMISLRKSEASAILVENK